MQQQVQARLDALKKELEKGQAELQKVEAQRTYLHETVLRISGAIQVLEELLQEGQPTEQSEAVSGEEQPASAQADGPTTGQPRARQSVRDQVTRPYHGPATDREGSNTDAQLRKE
jgi:hypothetical protein